MTYVIVPNVLREAILTEIEQEIEKLSEKEAQLAREDVESMYHQLLSYYYEHGVIPAFSLEKKK